jgi:hypothetical protein
MARTEARRQKQLAKKKARRDAKRHEVRRERSLSIPQRIAAPGGDIIDCLLNPGSVGENGIASAACAVRLKTGEIVYDALIAEVARLENVDFLVTLNPLHFRRVWPDASNRIVSPLDRAPSHGS